MAELSAEEIENLRQIHIDSVDNPTQGLFSLNIADQLVTSGHAVWVGGNAYRLTDKGREAIGAA